MTRSPNPRRSAATAVLALVLTVALTAGGCGNDPPAPPRPTAAEVVEALRAEGIPIGPSSDFGTRGCTLGDRCTDTADFLDNRSGVLPNQQGYEPSDRRFNGGRIEVFPDAEEALRRSEIIQCRGPINSYGLFAVFTAGPIVLSLGSSFLDEMGPTYTAADYRDALDRRYGPITFTAANFTPVNRGTGPPNATPFPVNTQLNLPLPGDGDQCPPFQRP